MRKIRAQERESDQIAFGVPRAPRGEVGRLFEQRIHQFNGRRFLEIGREAMRDVVVEDREHASLSAVVSRSSVQSFAIGAYYSVT